MHRLLDKQLSTATGADGQVDLSALLKQVAETYEQMDHERRGIVRSMQLMSDEANALTREMRGVWKLLSSKYRLTGGIVAPVSSTG